MGSSLVVAGTGGLLGLFLALLTDAAAGASWALLLSGLAPGGVLAGRAAQMARAPGRRLSLLAYKDPSPEEADLITPPVLDALGEAVRTYQAVTGRRLTSLRLVMMAPAVHVPRDGSHEEAGGPEFVFRLVAGTEHGTAPVGDLTLDAALREILAEPAARLQDSQIPVPAQGVLAAPIPTLRLLWRAATGRLTTTVVRFSWPLPPETFSAHERLASQATPLGRALTTPG